MYTETVRNGREEDSTLTIIQTEEYVLALDRYKTRLGRKAYAMKGSYFNKEHKKTIEAFFLTLCTNEEALEYFKERYKRSKYETALNPTIL